MLRRKRYHVLPARSAFLFRKPPPASQSAASWTFFPTHYESYA